MTAINATTRLRAASPKSLASKLDELIKAKSHTVHALEPEKENPTVSSSYWQAVGSLEALTAVRDALKGSFMNLNLL